MDKINTYSFCENFIERLADQIYRDCLKNENDLSHLAIVFGGKRPALFLKRALAKRIKTNFYPPHFFTIDQLVTHIIQQHEHFLPTVDLDSSYLIYSIVKTKTPHLLKNRKSFAEFLPWASELLSFIDQIDLENVSDKSLTNIEEIAKIGFPIPEEINQLLEQIVLLRNVYHEYLKKHKLYSRGFQYRRASQLIEKTDFTNFDKMIFCNFFYFNRSEEIIIESLYKRDKAWFIFQGDQRKWPILDRLAQNHAWEIKEGKQVDQPNFELKLYAGFDVHSQVGTVRKILEQNNDLENTVIVLPNPDNIVPLLSEISHEVKDFNISMGYPLKRSSLYSLFGLIFQAQASRRDNQYYARDYLQVLSHPFVKNLKLSHDPSLTRIIIHKIEEILTGKEVSSISGSLFFNLEDIEQLDELYGFVSEMYRIEDQNTSKDVIANDLRYMHQILFSGWERIDSFSDFTEIAEHFLNEFVNKSFLRNYPLNLNIAHKIFQILDEFNTAAFREEYFPKDEIFKVFERKISTEIVAFIGSPLKGLQLLGLFETRSLNFDHVIILDVNEGVLPRLKIYEPLIPRDVMISLGLNRVELDEEIQRYQFMRLISAAKKVHLVYQENKEKEKSRFVEELIWEEQKQKKKLNCVEIISPTFNARSQPELREVNKTPEMIEVLRKHSFSASSILTYLRNPIEFYYQYVLGLREKEDLLDEPEARHVGTFIHQILEDIFKPFLKTRPNIDASFITQFKKQFEVQFDGIFKKSMKSDSFLLRSVIWERLHRFILNEQSSAARQVDEILYLEHRFEDVIALSCGNIRFNYVIDRVDRMKDGTIMIIDYKTGTENLMPKHISQIEDMELNRESILENIKSFQIPLYFHYLHKEFKGQSINAALYNLRTLAVDKFINEKTVHTYEEIDQIFLKALDFVLCEILDINKKFSENNQVLGVI